MGAEPVITYPIPYERQSSVESNRTCGAACLSMVYRSLGQEVPQDEIWEAIAKVNRFGSLACTTHLMVADALKRGFDAVAFKARHPLFALRCCREANIRVILNHRLQEESPIGHYSVLVDIGDRDVTLHDPYFGPARRMTQGELMRLWDPGANSEIVGETMIAIAPRGPREAACEICRTPLPLAVVCQRCGKPVFLRPAAGIGCVGEGCVVRRWLQVCCPSCDYMWNFTEAAPAAAAAPAPQEPKKAEDPYQLDKLFAKLDEFCASIVAIPLAAGNPDVMKQIEFIKGSKGMLTQAAAKQTAVFEAERAKRAATAQKLREAKEARKAEKAKAAPPEETPGPLPPLDGNAIGMALLKNMGLIR